MKNIFKFETDLIKPMNASIRKTGILATSFIIASTLLFIVTIFIFPPERFISTSDFLKNFKINHLIPVIPAFLLVLANIPLFAALYFYADSQGKIFGLTGILFGTGYMVCSGINYYTQLGLITRNLSEAGINSIQTFLMENSNSFALAVDNLSYTFLALAFLAFSGIFSNRGLQSWIKTLFIIYGISGLLGSIGYILHFPLLENLLLISSLPYLGSIILLFIEFKKLKSSI